MPEVTKRDIAAVIVLYHPSVTVRDNVTAFASQVDRVFAVDNSEQPDSALVYSLRTCENLDYLALGDNLGIAAALNAGAERARAAGYSWILTMDQDSAPEPDMVEKMLACLDSEPATPEIGILSPEYHQVGAPAPQRVEGCADVLTTMTSGNLLSLAAFGDVGPFMEELFIDRVDAEYCLRLHRGGYRVVVAGGAVLHHRVGATRRRRFPYPAFPSNHSPLRHYYIARNRFAVARMYRTDFPGYGRFEMRHLAKEIAKVLLYETSKLEKLRMMWRGYRDYRRGRTGRFEENAR
jgi:rhamnosyltransferase